MYEPSRPNHFVESAANLEMIWVEPGTFTMGRNDLWKASPEHKVTLTSGYYLGKYEVTHAQFEAVMANLPEQNSKPGTWSNFSNRPVENVSWDDAQIFIEQLNFLEENNLDFGWEFHLPTEAEWEYACRAGTSTLYSWGNEINSSLANYNWDGGAASGNDYQHTRDVGSYAPNHWGFYDMHGNVWEWVQDWYAPYGNIDLIDPSGPATGTEIYGNISRIWRGGSWSTTYDYLPSTNRAFEFPPSTRQTTTPASGNHICTRNHRDLIHYSETNNRWLYNSNG